MITLNPDMWSDVETVNALVLREAASGGHIGTNGAQAIITHEYGHVVHNTLALKKVGYTGSGNLSKAQRGMYMTEREKISTEVFELLENQGLNINSQRAKEEVDELIAEAFSDYYSGCKSKASRAVVSYFKKEMR